MRTLFLVGLFVFHQQLVTARDTFYWDWHFDGLRLKVSGRMNSQKETSVYVDAQRTINRFVLVYLAIEEKNHSQLPLYLKTVDTLSEELVKPFLPLLKHSGAIVLNLDPQILFSPVEVLMVDSTPLALFRPMVFQMNNRPDNIDADTVRISKGFILRDSTADTDNNCRDILNKYPGSDLKYIRDLKTANLAEERNIDFLLVSAHGNVDGSSLKGGIIVNDSSIIQEDFLIKTNPKLIYMDACVQGINTTYIQSLAKTERVNYYIASLITVDLSDAATRTLRLFFALLDRSHNPALSLWNTKLEVFETYKDPAVVTSVLTTINKSLLFRIYKL